MNWSTVDAGLVEPELSRAMDFYRLWINAARAGESRDTLEPAIAKARKEKWFPQVAAPRKGYWLWKWYPPVDPSLAGIGQALITAGNTDHTQLIIPGAAHNLTIQPERGKPFFWWYGAPGYSDLLTAWLRLRFAGKD